MMVFNVETMRIEETNKNKKQCVSKIENRNAVYFNAICVLL